MTLSFQVLSTVERQKLHEASLQVLEQAGMRFESEALLRGLAAAGARVLAPGGRVILPNDNPASLTDAFARACLGGFLRLTPVKRALMSDTLRSRFLGALKHAAISQGKGHFAKM